MKLSVSKNFNSNQFIHLQNEEYLINQRIAGKITAQALSLLNKQIENKTNISLIELNNLAEEFIYDSKGIPTFKNYRNFPAGVCISVNKQLVHSIPTDYHLQDGDLVTFDLGVTYNRSIADSAFTTIFGEIKSERHINLINSTKEALKKGIEAVKVGKKIGCIGNAISKYAKEKEFSIVTKYGGHGIGYTPHCEPFISNKDSSDNGIIIQKGLTIAIEPLLVIGSSNNTYTDKDGWTVYCDNICAHEEHTLYVHEDYVEIITSRDFN